MQKDYEQLGKLIYTLADYCREIDARSIRWPGHDYPYDTDLEDDEILDDTMFFQACSRWIPEQKESFLWPDKLWHLMLENFNCYYRPDSGEYWFGDDEGEWPPLIEKALKLLRICYEDQIRDY